MRRCLDICVLLALFAVLSHSEKARGPLPGEWLPSTLGWHKLEGTQIAPLCPKDPAIEGNTGCRAVIAAWNGGIADIRRNRLLFWGGGHGDYFGNEVYALDVERQEMLRITDPSPVNNVSICPETYPDGRPVARHTYNGLVYLPTEDKMFVYGGSKSECGLMSTATWTLDLSTLQWSRKDPHLGDTPADAPGVVADYDPNSGVVFLADTYHLFRYNPSSNAFDRLSRVYGMDYHLTGVIDPSRKLFLMFGGTKQAWAVDIRPGSDYAVQDWSKSIRGCEAVMTAPYPGLAYDPDLKLIVAWIGGDTVYLFDPGKRVCTSQTFSGGPGAAQTNGTHGRFRYFPALGVFALVNDWKQEAYVLRLTPKREK